MSNFADKNESKTTALDTSMDITPPASDAGNDIGLNDSTSKRQSVQSISANDTKVSNAGSLSRKQHCPHWTVSYTLLIGHFNNESNGRKMREWPFLILGVMERK
ncbi:hypothetical protein FHG87_021804 [Trinorchestia longiramus]|nr:hypothetical protein FHG87_021804 [Trinorchestia longiramus]